MIIDFECKNCIHFPVCELKSEANDIISALTESEKMNHLE